MKVTITMADLTKEDIAGLLQDIRDWGKAYEQTIPFLLETDPPLSKEEAHQLLAGVFPYVEHDIAPVIVRDGALPELHLGNRMVVVGGDIIGTCDDIHLVIGAATEQTIENLRDAQKIEFIRIQAG